MRKQADDMFSNVPGIPEALKYSVTVPKTIQGTENADMFNNALKAAHNGAVAAGTTAMHLGNIGYNAGRRYFYGGHQFGPWKIPANKQKLDQVTRDQTLDHRAIEDVRKQKTLPYKQIDGVTDGAYAPAFGGGALLASIPAVWAGKVGGSGIVKGFNRAAGKAGTTTANWASKFLGNRAGNVLGNVVNTGLKTVLGTNVPGFMLYGMGLAGNAMEGLKATSGNNVKDTTKAYTSAVQPIFSKLGIPYSGIRAMFKSAPVQNSFFNASVNMAGDPDMLWNRYWFNPDSQIKNGIHKEVKPYIDAAKQTVTDTLDKTDQIRQQNPQVDQMAPAAKNMFKQWYNSSGIGPWFEDNKGRFIKFTRDLMNTQAAIPELPDIDMSKAPSAERVAYNTGVAGRRLTNMLDRNNDATVQLFQTGDQGFRNLRNIFEKAKNKAYSYNGGAGKAFSYLPFKNKATALQRMFSNKERKWF